MKTFLPFFSGTILLSQTEAYYGHHGLSRRRPHHGCKWWCVRYSIHCVCCSKHRTSIFYQWCICNNSSKHHNMWTLTFQYYAKVNFPIYYDHIHAYWGKTSLFSVIWRFSSPNFLLMLHISYFLLVYFHN